MPFSAASSWVSSRGNPYVSYSSNAAAPLTDAVLLPFLFSAASSSSASSLFRPAGSSDSLSARCLLNHSMNAFLFTMDCVSPNTIGPRAERCILSEADQNFNQDPGI